MNKFLYVFLFFSNLNGLLFQQYCTVTTKGLRTTALRSGTVSPIGAETPRAITKANAHRIQ